MIHMLSKFDLNVDTDLEKFEKPYCVFFEHAKKLGLAEETSKVGSRITDTPMDTDAADVQEHYVIMSFQDRKQLDCAYDYMDAAEVPLEERKPYATVKRIVRNAVFTCWQE